MNEIIIPVKEPPGTLAVVSESLARADINIEFIEARVVGESGIIVLRVDRYDAALRILRDAGYRAVTEDALVLDLENRPGALAEVARRWQTPGSASAACGSLNGLVSEVWWRWSRMIRMPPGGYSRRNAWVGAGLEPAGVFCSQTI